MCLQKAAGNGDVLHPVPSLIAALANPANPTKGRPESIPVFLTGLVHCSGPDRIQANAQCVLFQYNAPVSKMALYRIQ